MKKRPIKSQIKTIKKYAVGLKAKLPFDSKIQGMQGVTETGTHHFDFGENLVVAGAGSEIKMDVDLDNKKCVGISFGKMAVIPIEYLDEICCLFAVGMTMAKIGARPWGKKGIKRIKELLKLFRYEERYQEKVSKRIEAIKEKNKSQAAQIACAVAKRKAKK